MSMTFQVGENVLWAPSIRLGRLFKGQADVVASVFGTPSGIGDIIEDECEVEPEVFGAFLVALLQRYQDSAHPILKSLLTGFLATALVMADRAALPLPGLPTDQAAAWQALRTEQSRSMSR